MSDADLKTTTALTVPPAASLPLIIANDSTGLLSALAVKVNAYRPDGSTAEGRAVATSLAYQVATTKGALIRIGKGLTEQWRKDTKAVNAECNVLEQRMDWLRDEIRKPATEWEAIETTRKAGHEAAIKTIQESAAFYASENSVEDLRSRLNALSHPFPRNWQEYGGQADALYASEIHLTTAALASAMKREADSAELSKLRAQKAVFEAQEAERQKAARDAQIAADAAAAAVVAHDAKLAKAEATRIEAAARAEREAAAAAIRFAEMSVKMEEQRVEALAQAERDQAAAIETERKSVAAAIEKQAREQAARDQDLTRRVTAGTHMRAEFVRAGMSLDCAYLAVNALFDGKIPHITITL